MTSYKNLDEIITEEIITNAAMLFYNLKKFNISLQTIFNESKAQLRFNKNLSEKDIIAYNAAIKNTAAIKSKLILLYCEAEIIYLFPLGIQKNKDIISQAITATFKPSACTCTGSCSEHI